MQILERLTIEKTKLQVGQWVDIIDHWSIIDHFVKMIDVLEFEVNITLKWLIFHQNIPEAVMLFV